MTGTRTSQIHRVAVLALPDCQILDAVGPLEVFSHAQRMLQGDEETGPRYELMLLGLDTTPIPTSQGTRLVPDAGFPDAPMPDTLLIAGGRGLDGFEPDPSLRTWIRRCARHCARYGSVCTGALLLARCGLLDGHTVTTHWRYCHLLEGLGAEMNILSDAIFTQDDNLYTSAGVTAGIDLSLYFVEQDLGRELALEIARDLVVYMKRPGGQSQFSARLAVQISESSPFRHLCHWLNENLDQELRVEDLATRVHMSPRNFTRQFHAELGIPPAHYIERLRIDTARELLCDTRKTLTTIALETGFGNGERMRRAFSRTLGVSPSGYRARFTQGSRAGNT